MDFEWTAEDEALRAELRSFLAEGLPGNWDEIAKHGPGSDAQAAFARARGAAGARWPRA